MSPDPPSFSYFSFLFSFFFFNINMYLYIFFQSNSLAWLCVCMFFFVCVVVGLFVFFCFFFGGGGLFHNKWWQEFLQFQNWKQNGLAFIFSLVFISECYYVIFSVMNLMYYMYRELKTKQKNDAMYSHFCSFSSEIEKSQTKQRINHKS